MSLHIIHFMKSINPDTLAGLQNVTLSAIKDGATEIQIHISSDGGNNDQGFTAYNFLKSLSVPLTMHCIGNIESMAVIMFLACRKRIIVPHGKVKIHPMHWGFSAGQIDHDRLAEFVSSLDFDANRYADIFEENTQSASEIVNVREHLAGKAKLLTSDEAIKAGIAHEIKNAEVPQNAVKWWV